MTTPDIAGLCKRLRRIGWYTINPDGPEAADTIERQAAEIERLRGALAGLLALHDSPTRPGDSYAEARAALTGEDALQPPNNDNPPA
jgi:hypothetical protein